MSRRKRPVSITASSSDAPKAIGPASTPRLNDTATPFQPEQLSSLLKPTASGVQAGQSKGRWKAAGSDQDASEAGLGAEERDDEGELLFNEGMWRWGMALVVCSTLCFVVGFWSIAVGPFVNTEGVLVFDALAKDTHYKYLLIFLVPVTLYAVIVNWWGLKIFRHA